VCVCVCVCHSGFRHVFEWQTLPDRTAAHVGFSAARIKNSFETSDRNPFGSRVLQTFPCWKMCTPVGTCEVAKKLLVECLCVWRTSTHIQGWTQVLRTDRRHSCLGGLEVCLHWQSLLWILALCPHLVMSGTYSVWHSFFSVNSKHETALMAVLIPLFLFLLLCNHWEIPT